MLHGYPLVPVVAGLLVLAVIMIMMTLAKMYRKAGPHEALIIYGTGSEARIVKGSGTIIWPMLQMYLLIYVNVYNHYVSC